MQNEQLQKWALIAEIVGGIAVVLSLIFVGFQIQQSSKETALNTRAIEVNAYQDLINQIFILNNEFLGDPELSDLWARANDCEDITVRAEQEQLRRYQASVVRHGDMAYHQYEQGLISEERLNSALAILAQHITASWPIWEYWDRRKTLGNIYEPYQKHVDNLVVARGGTVHPCPNLVRN